MKVKAFTIIELMIVSVLSLLTATAVFSSVSILSTQFERFRNETSSRVKVIDFGIQLKDDFSNSNFIQLSGDSLRLYFNSPKQVYYVLGDSIQRLVRLEENSYLGHKIPLESARMFYEGVEVKEGVVDALELSVQEDSSSIIFYNRSELSSANKLSALGY